LDDGFIFEALAAITLSVSVPMAVAWMAQQHSGNSGSVEKEWHWMAAIVGAPVLDWRGNFDSHSQENRRYSSQAPRRCGARQIRPANRRQPTVVMPAKNGHPAFCDA
jgi:hypothetical protein